MTSGRNAGFGYTPLWHYLQEVKYCLEVMLEMRGRPVHVIIGDGELGRRDTPQWYYLQEVKYHRELVYLRLEAVRSRSSYEMASLVERIP